MHSILGICLQKKKRKEISNYVCIQYIMNWAEFLYQLLAEHQSFAVTQFDYCC